MCIGNLDEFVAGFFPLRRKLDPNQALPPAATIRTIAEYLPASSILLHGGRVDEDARIG